MKLLYKSTFRISFLLLLGCISLYSNAQTGKDSLARQMSADSAQINAVKEKLKRNFKDSLSYNSDTIVALLVQKIEAITELVNEANNISESGFDTLEISRNLPSAERLLNIAENDFVPANSIPNLRTLKTAKGMLLQIEKQIDGWQQTLFKYSDKLADLKIRLSAVSKDSILRKFPKDSLLRDLYLGQLAALAVRWKQADSVNNKNLFGIGLLQNRVAATYLKTRELAERTNEKIDKYIQDIWKPEEPSLFRASPASYDESLGNALIVSVTAIFKLVIYYFNLNANLWVTAVIIILLIYLWFRRILIKLKKDHLSPDEIKRNALLITERPLLAATALVLTFISFFFFNLPPSWNTLSWIVLAIVYFSLNTFSVNKNKAFRMEFLLLFIAFNLLGAIYKNSFGERWLQFTLDLVNITYGLMMLKRIHKNQSSFPWYTRNVFLIFVIFSGAALLANTSGCFMLAKALNNGAVYSVITAHILFTTSQMIIQFIYLQYEAFKENKLASYFDFYNIQTTLSKALRMAAIAGWLVIMAQQLNVFDYAYEWVASFLTTERKLGENAFTFGSILVFLFVIWLSSFISKLIIVFFGQNKLESNTKKSRWSSMLILIRLAILSTGILIAFAASGIPMDKLTIIIGALGVGIGFGLQNIVNNLVSGVILAFEKPVQIGDAIEVGNRYGTVKEIGIRSSKILTVEGSEVIVPNGDMLSQHIVNWTLTNNYRRVEIIVGVAYSTNLRIAEKILLDIISTQKGIESIPPPQVLVHQFGESSVDFRLLFWCHIDTWINVKSEVLMNVHNSFGEQGIEIPFPQRDINIKGEGNLLTKNGEKARQEDDTLKTSTAQEKD